MTDIDDATIVASRKKRKKRLESHRACAERQGVSPRTIDRWVKLGILPAPIRIRGRKYFDADVMPKRDITAT
jgi:DNA-binding transcriptional MerR regulator